MERIRLRDYREGDFDDILNVWQRTGLTNDERGDNAEIIECSLQWGGKFFILEEKESQRIIGTCWITNDSRRLYLHHLGVLPEFQDRGYGKLLLLESIRFGKQVNLQMKLEVHVTNTNAIHMYEKMGFKHLGDYDVYIIRDMANFSALPGLLQSK
ncbi:MAG: GNAT family N-acetyltransferase [Marinifilaceae bacterium]|jgi:ribosomal protein S18 acetylase RimI-like enzyme